MTLPCWHKYLFNYSKELIMSISEKLEEKVFFNLSVKTISFIIVICFGMFSSCSKSECLICCCASGSGFPESPNLEYCEDGDLTFMGDIYPNLNELTLAINQFDSRYQCRVQ